MVEHGKGRAGQWVSESMLLLNPWSNMAGTDLYC